MAPSVRGYVTYGSTSFTSTETFDAITGKTSKDGVGVGGTVDVWRGLFIDGAISQHKLDGDRVFVDGGTVYRLGIPVTIKMRPVDFAAGWRFFFGRVSP